ncbi:SH2 domain-containing protein 6 [Tachysurus vachellii]|uniref:SH2 domain-containing protein 6 n=1 Tax=Tachysurus vachellii TaxID=175792 RepID=UPI00296AB078|nr:SH2 domain-containing protein 6 [Tachysurus vachellii]
MSFFEKLKNLHCGPPAPPKRIETITGCGWAEDELDEEDGDTYEAPPCERPTIKVQHRHEEENVYLGYPERTPNSTNPQRQAGPPPPRPAKITPKMKSPKPLPDQEEFYLESNRKCPEVFHKDQATKRLAPRKSPPAVPAPNLEEDVYLDPNEGQSVREPTHDIYVEPTTDCCLAPPSVPYGGGRMFPPKTAARDLPLYVMKPPVPRAKSNSLVTSDSVNAASLPDARSNTITAHVPSSFQSIRPNLAIETIKDCKTSSPISPAVDNTATVIHPGEQEMGLQDREWFAGICGRKTAEDTLLKVNKNGSYLVRCSTAQNARQPFTLVVLFNQKVYNIPIRFIKESCSYALGKEGKKSEELFDSLQEMISHHKDNPLLLIDSKSQAKHTTYLTHPVHL